MTAYPARGGAPTSTAQTGLSWLVVLFLFALIVPIILNLGPLRLSVYRVVLLVTFLPALLMWLSGRAGRILAADIMVLVMVLWMSLSNLYHFGVGASIEPIGILTLEHLGAYLLGRVFIRSAEAFRKLAWVGFLLCLILLPFAIYESMTANNLYMSLWSKVGSVPPDVYKDPRLGLDRFQGPFDHPILPGVFATPILGLVCFVLGYKRGFVSTVMLTSVVFVTGFLCVSSGPLSALAVQLGFITWNVIFRRVESRWWILLGLTVLGYIIVDIISNRSPIEVAISRLALNAQTGIGRIWIFQWAWVNIFEYPIFGLGDGDWKRYYFMTESFDMFWMLYAMRLGLIAGLAQTAAPMWLIVSMMMKKMPDERLAAYRMGWLIGIAGIIMAGWMVHFWNAPLVLFYFILGAGCWLLDAANNEPGTEVEVTDTPDPAGQKNRFSRFAPRPAGVPQPAGASVASKPAQTARASLPRRTPAQPQPAGPSFTRTRR